jgi:hypothetical protein
MVYVVDVKAYTNQEEFNLDFGHFTGMNQTNWDTILVRLYGSNWELVVDGVMNKKDSRKRYKATYRISKMNNFELCEIATYISSIKNE